eukprot:TRINITY_DN6207_c0_g1_i3.p1 TRINITY_DN6207_c0_g1~~TRINITY_DN6207_c0_g1_i3.p1  ORF type:complete len:165 (-),score=56.11 TRINITY_DN6207_c0_g1_i3:98-592(-)
MIRRPPRSTQGVSSAASDVYKRQYQRRVHGMKNIVLPQIDNLQNLFLSVQDSMNKLKLSHEEELNNITNIIGGSSDLLRRAVEDCGVNCDNDDFTELAKKAGEMLLVSQEKINEYETFDKPTVKNMVESECCLLYTSDAADDTPCVDLGGRRIIKKKKNSMTSS